MEGAVRVFAGEYNASTLQVRAEGADDPPGSLPPVAPGAVACISPGP